MCFSSESNLWFPVHKFIKTFNLLSLNDLHGKNRSKCGSFRRKSATPAQPKRQRNRGRDRHSGCSPKMPACRNVGIPLLRDARYMARDFSGYAPFRQLHAASAVVISSSQGLDRTAKEPNRVLFRSPKSLRTHCIPESAVDLPPR